MMIRNEDGIKTGESIFIIQFSLATVNPDPGDTVIPGGRDV
jgi:hypothetical protein